MDPKEPAMPGVDFDRLRLAITMEQVLDLLEFECTQRRGDQWHGYCPLHESEPRHRRVFSVNVMKSCYRCHYCSSQGDQFTLWAEATGLPLYQATIALCKRLSLDIPWIHHW